VTEEEKQDETPGQPPAEEAQADEPDTQTDEPVEEPATGSPSEDEAPITPPPEAATETPAADQVPAEEVPIAAEESSAEPEAAAEQPEAAAEPTVDKLKAKDQAPGADLEPIKLEPERELDAEERARLEAEEEERARLEALAAAVNEPVARTGPKVELAKDAQIQATGKRKSAIARVILRPGSGAFDVNGHTIDVYFPREYLQTVARQSLVTAGYESNVDVIVRVHGGGISGQAGAVRHGIARALCEIDPELRPELKRRGLLTRDARKKERRKAGLKKARKKPQFSKR